MFLSGASCLPMDSYFSELALKIQLSMLVYYKADNIIISLNVTEPHHDIAEN